MTGSKIVDRRFAEAVERAIRKGSDIKRPFDVSDVARGIGVSRETVYLWIKGAAEIRWVHLRKFYENAKWEGTWQRAFANDVALIYSDLQKQGMKKYLRR